MKSEFLAAVKKHARDNYNQDGFDIVVESWDDSKINEVIQGAQTVNEAINLVKAKVKLIRVHEKDIQSEAF